MATRNKNDARIEPTDRLYVVAEDAVRLPTLVVTLVWDYGRLQKAQ